MSTYIISVVTVIYCLYDVMRLNKEINDRITNYQFNSKNIKQKPLYSESMTAFLYLLVLIVSAVITAVSISASIVTTYLIVVIHKIIRRRKIKTIYRLDLENADYWK